MKKIWNLILVGILVLASIPSLSYIFSPPNEVSASLSNPAITRSNPNAGNGFNRWEKVGENTYKIYGTLKTAMGTSSMPYPKNATQYESYYQDVLYTLSMPSLLDQGEFTGVQVAKIRYDSSLPAKWEWMDHVGTRNSHVDVLEYIGGYSIDNLLLSGNN